MVAMVVSSRYACLFQGAIGSGGGQFTTGFAGTIEIRDYYFGLRMDS
jgi:hypothetical protein